MHGPLIALAGRIGAPGKVSRTPVVFGGRRYFDAVLRSGAKPVLLTPHPTNHSDAMAMLRRFDGLVLLGGSDVDPEIYGQTPHPSVYGVNREADEFECQLVRAAAELELPTLAICRGLQVANVALGGTLHQHLGDLGLLEDHAPAGFPSPPEGVIHPVAIETSSRLAKALGTDSVEGASYHHQALDRVAPGLVVTARAPDGIIEGAELEVGWFVGVQWHPEDLAAQQHEHQQLFDSLAQQAGDTR